MLATTYVVLETNTLIVINAQHSCWRSKYPGYILKSQALLNHDGNYYDKIDILIAYGKQLSIYFDIAWDYRQLQT